MRVGAEVLQVGEAVREGSVVSVALCYTLGASLLMNELQTTSSLKECHCLAEEHIPGPVVCRGASGLFVCGVRKCRKGVIPLCLT